LRWRFKHLQDLEKNFAKDGFKINVKQLVDFQEDYGLKGDDDEEEDEEDSEGSEGSEEESEEE
jgi:hypothetical protein